MTRLRRTWWRHLAGVVGLVISLFPVVYVVSSSVNRDQTLGGASIVPTHVTLHNFGSLLRNDVSTSGGGKADAPYVAWYLNSLVVALVTALLTVVLGALAAYAFSRFRFRGRRLGMMTLLLIQMFPQFLAVAALYLIIRNVGDIFGIVGLNTLTGLIVVYLGGAMGVQTWLMKGFFDTIPVELDESARVDGATPAQVFWAVVLPLATPVIAVIGVISFVGTLNEFVIASALLQTTDHFTLPVGMRGFIDQQYGQRWGPFAAGTVLAAVPVVVLFMSLQRWIVSGLTAGSVKG
jgi:arabinogalactan oligomer/maltooligosaccharide transport system permease protein